MLGLKYFKAEPTEFARIRAGNKVRKEGVGISGFYMPFRTTIEMVSVATKDHPFVFQEFSKDNQEIAIQGGFIYRISDPTGAIDRYNFSIDPRTKHYLAEDPVKLPEQILQLVRGKARGIIQSSALEDLLITGDDLAQRVTESLGQNEIIGNIGVDFQTLYFESIRPTPEIGKALEATYREKLLQQADEAIFERRAIAVEKERTIQENQLQTEVALEEQRKGLVELQGANALEEAKYRANAVKLELAAYEGTGPEMVAAQALLRLGENAEKIGNLTITPDIYASLMQLARTS